MDVVSRSNALKAAGNAFFAEGRYKSAILNYTEAIQVNSISNEKIYSNRAAAYTKLMMFEHAINDCKKVQELNPNWSKGYVREGDAQMGLGNYELAFVAFNKAKSLGRSYRYGEHKIAKCLFMKENGIKYCMLNTIDSMDTIASVRKHSHPIEYISKIDQKQYIIVVSEYENDAKHGIYRYDINNDKFEKYIDYPDDFSPGKHTIAMDNITNNLYIIGYNKFKNKNCFCFVNLDNKTWNFLNIFDTFLPIYLMAELIYVFSSFDGTDLYIVGYRMETGAFFLKCETKDHNCTAYKMSHEIQKLFRTNILTFNYIKSRKMFLCTTSSYDGTDTFWLCIDKNNELKHKLFFSKLHWQPQIKLTQIVAFDSLVFLLYHDADKYALNTEIYCVDLLNKMDVECDEISVYNPIDKIAHCTGKHFPVSFGNCSFNYVKTHDNYVHFMGMESDSLWGTDRDKVFVHLRFDLHQLISDDLRKIYAKKYKPIISGCIHDLERKHDKRVPTEIIYLIIQYYPLFL